MRETVATIDVGAFKHNLRTMKAFLKPETHLMAVVKADAYGHGDVYLAKAALETGADWLAVALNEEALHLRDNGVGANILILGPSVDEDSLEAVISRDVSVTLYTREQLLTAQRIGERIGKPARVHLKIETGFNRIGIDVDKVAGFMEQLKRSQGAVLEGMFTHFARADELEDSFVHKQYAALERAEKIVNSYGVYPIVHACNSNAIPRYPQYHRNMVRVGIALYGYLSSPARELTDLRPVMEITTKIDRVRRADKGEVVGYGCSYSLPQDADIATIPIGYADGYSRQLGNRGKVIVNGRLCPVVGRVCMDRIMADVSGADAKPGDEAVIMGSRGGVSFTAEDMADICSTITYEVFTNISKRVPRRYIDA